MTDHRERARLAIEQLTALRKAYTPDQGGADVVYGDALYDLANYPWDEAILRIRAFAHHGMDDKSFAAYLKVRSLVAPEGYPPLEPVSVEAIGAAKWGIHLAHETWREAIDRHSALLRRAQTIEGEARAAAREASMKGEGT